MVDTCPDAKGPYKMSFTVRQKWSVIYDQYYLPMCQSNDLPVLPKNRFCELRKLHRPNYIRHRKVNNNTSK